MSSASTNRAPGFFWILAVFATFAIVAALLNLLGAQDRPNPRDAERAALAAEIKKGHQDSLKQMGLVWGDSSKTLVTLLPKLQAMTPSKSAMLVPGSPTQLKQAAAAAPAAPATTPTQK